MPRPLVIALAMYYALLFGGGVAVIILSGVCEYRHGTSDNNTKWNLLHGCQIAPKQNWKDVP